MDIAISLTNLGKMYKLFYKQQDKVWEAFGWSKYLFWRKNNYQEFWALRNIDLDIIKGERVGIIGKNGAGKSTLLKIITGNVTPTEGNVIVNGKIQALMELGTGFHPEFTGRENIKASLTYHGYSPKKIKQLEEEIIDFTELEDFINQPIKYYSAGMYTRLAFAVSTVLEPEILIIDEILGAGDASFTTKCSLRMKKLTQETGATVLFVSHSMESVLEICNRAILINQGTISHDADPLSVSKIYNKMIRVEDELLIRAREARLRKKDYRALKQLNSDYEPLLFRFTTDQDHPQFKHLFYNISLLSDENVLGEIVVGGPMDNDTNALNRIIDGVGMMDWSKSQMQGKKCYRTYQNEEGVYCHAPFQMCIPTYLLDNDNISLRINADINKNEPVHLELWLEDKYQRVATFLKEGTSYNVLLSDYLKLVPIQEDDTLGTKVCKEDENKEIKKQEEYSYETLQSTNSIYGTQELIIKNIDIFDNYDKSKRVFFLGETLKFKIELFAKELVPSFVIVASILSNDGKPVGQVFCESEKIGIKNVEGKINIDLIYEPLRFGLGEYIVSIGAFKNCDMTVERENESYCVVDRAVFFKVQQPEHIKKGLGAFAHSCIWRHGENKFTYDPAEYFRQQTKY